MSDNQCQICFEGKTKQEIRKQTYEFKNKRSENKPMSSRVTK